jgi:hypothetical protein|tara:strand:- start:1650 stop:1883 length:234 start_codon:yes stop_codon:yes gene_type:complete
MSRYHKQINENKELFYGSDHTLGYWYEVWDHNENGEYPVEVGDQALEHTTRTKIIEVFEKYDVEAGHINSVLYNLPF